EDEASPPVRLADERVVVVLVPAADLDLVLRRAEVEELARREPDLVALVRVARVREFGDARISVAARRVRVGAESPEILRVDRRRLGGDDGLGLRRVVFGEVDVLALD